MKLRNARFLIFAAVSASVALFWALPALAHPARSAASVTVTAGKPSEFHFTLSLKKVAHGVVTFKFFNKGNLPHDFKVCSSNLGGTANTCTGHATTTISPGGTATLKVTFKKAGKYEYLCTLPAHAQSGMKGVLVVT